MTEKEKQEINICIKEIQCGNKNALERLHIIIGPSIRFIALKYLHSNDLADDLVQDFWAQLTDKLDNFRYSQNGYAYLQKIIKNMALNKCKQLQLEKKRLVPIEYIDYSQIKTYTPAPDPEQIELSNKVNVALNKLSTLEKNIIQITFFEDKSIRAIAKELKISKSKAERLKLSAIEKLKNEFDKNWDKTEG